MAQVTSKTPDQVLAANATVSVPQTGNTVLLTLPVEDMSELGVEVSVTGQALDAFIVSGKMHPDAAFQTLYSLGTAYTSPAGLIIAASGDLTLQAAGTTGWVFINVTPLYEVQISASSGNVAGSTVTARAIAKRGRVR